MIHARGPRGSATAPLFGREEVVEEVAHLLDRAKTGAGQGLLLTGARGIGKSHALRAAIDQASGRGFRVLSGRALPEELPPAFSLLRDLLRSGGEDTAPTPAATAPGAPLPIFLAPFAEETPPPRPVATVTPFAGAAPDDLERILAPLGNTAAEGLGAGRDEMLGHLREYFLEVVGLRPALLAIDDLHFADTSSLEFLRRFASDLPGLPVVVIATVAEGGEVPARTQATIEALTRSEAFRSIALRPLSVPEVSEFVRWILGGRAPERAEVLRWHAQTEGNPLFVEQLVRTTTGYSLHPPAPTATPGRDLTEILLSRVRALGETERRILTYAAVLGKEFHFSSLTAVAGMDEERVTEYLDRLVQGGLVREKGHEVYEFVTEAVRASVYAELTETRRRILHRKAGRALEAKGGATDSELARQFFLGGEDDRAVEYDLRAAQSATLAFAFETAVSHISRALEADRRRPERDRRLEARLLTEEGRLLDELGSLYRSEEVLTEAVELARSQAGYDLELGRALLGLAQTRADRGGYASAASLATEASGLLEKVGHPRDLMAAHRVLGVVYYRQGDRTQAEAHHRAALEIAQREGTPREHGHALVDVANTLVPLGAAGFEPALELYTKAAELFETAADHGARARVLMNRSVLKYGVNRTEEALRDLAAAIEAAERSRSPIWIGYCHLNLAQWQAELGHPGPAATALERAVQVLSPIGDRLGEQQIAMSRGMIAEAERSYEPAERHFQDALAQARELRMVAEVSEMLFRLAQVAHERGDDDEARARLAEARSGGLLDHRPDFGPRVVELERALGGSA